MGSQRTTAYARRNEPLGAENGVSFPKWPLTQYRIDRIHNGAESKESTPEKAHIEELHTMVWLLTGGCGFSETSTGRGKSFTSQYVFRRQ